MKPGWWAAPVGTGISGAAMLVLAVALRGSLVGSMSLHMLVHIPMLVVAGILLARALQDWLVQPARREFTRRLAVQAAACNQHGIPGLLYATFVGMYWMIPKALDSVLLSPQADMAKFASVVLAGMWLYGSWRRAHNVIRLFFLGGFCWTSAIAGMLYQESTARLCNFYLMNDQTWAGRGLVILAIILPAGWLLSEVHAHKRTRQPAAAAPHRIQEQS